MDWSAFFYIIGAGFAAWLIYKTKIVGTYTFIYAQKVWGLLPL